MRVRLEMEKTTDTFTIPSQRTGPPLLIFLPPRQPADSQFRLLMRAKLAQRDSKLIAKVAVITGAYAKIRKRKVGFRKMILISLCSKD